MLGNKAQRMRVLLVVAVLSTIAAALAHADGGKAKVQNDRVTCGSACFNNTDCSSEITNPCTFCLKAAGGDKGECVSMCGIGCGSDSDCAGGSNPCTVVRIS